jgi:hypothetical protein
MMDVDGATLSSGEQRWSLCVRGCVSFRIRNHPSDEWVYLQGRNEAAAGAVYVLAVSLFFILIHSIGSLLMDTTSQSTSALATNGAVFWWQRSRFNASPFHQRALAWAPTVVHVDPITGARVFLLRWCEWTPLAGLMTFLAEAVDLPRRKSGIRVRIYSALLQSISCLFGIIFRFVTAPSWGICMTLSMVTYLGIFPRVWIKRQQFLQTPRGTSLWKWNTTIVSLAVAHENAQRHRQLSLR